MAQTIKLKRSSTQGKTPTTSQLDLGELAINTYDGLLYIKKDDGTPTVIRVNDRNTDDLAEGSTNLYFTDQRVRDVLENYPITNLHDVNVTSVADGDRLEYNATNERWENVSNDMSTLNNDMWEVTSTVPTDGTGKPTGYVWYIV